jgi:teichuronic acid biosynthesis glycosyltransferase TuaC
VRIAIITTSYPAFAGDPSGHFVEREATDLSALGHEVHVVAPGQRDAVVQIARAPGVHRIVAGEAFGWPGALQRIRQRPLRSIAVFGFAWRAQRVLRGLGQLDRIIAHWILPSAWPIACYSRAASRLEVVVHGSDARLLLKLPAALRKHIFATLLERGAHFRFVASELRELLVSDCSNLRESSSVRASPLDLSVAPERNTARRALGIGSGERVALVIGRLIPQKRMEIALSAALLLPRARVVVVGDGPERTRLARRFPQAQFIGLVPREQALTWLAAADVVCNASRHEGAPTALREARGLDVPVVAAPCGDLRQQATRDPGIWLVR